MMHSISFLIGAGAVALGAAVGFVDPFDSNRLPVERVVCNSDSSCGQNSNPFAEGYRHGYGDGLAHRQRSVPAGAYDFGNRDTGATKGAFYFINAAAPARDEVLAVK